MLLDCECWDKQVVLLNVSGDSRKDVHVNFRPIEVSSAADSQFPSVSECQAIEKCRLSSPARSHDGEKFTRLDAPRDCRCSECYFGYGWPLATKMI